MEAFIFVEAMAKNMKIHTMCSLVRVCNPSFHSLAMGIASCVSCIAIIAIIAIVRC